MNNNDRKKNSFLEINEHQKIALAQKDGKELNKLIAGMDSGIHLLKNEGKKERPRDDMHGTAKDCGSELQIEEARLIIEKEELQDGYLYVPFIHILNYEGIILEKVNEGYRVCRRSVSERDCESDYDVAVFRNEEEALEDFIIKLRELNELRKATARYYEKQRKKSELDRLTVKISIIVLILVGILGLVKLLS